MFHLFIENAAVFFSKKCDSARSTGTRQAGKQALASSPLHSTPHWGRVPEHPMMMYSCLRKTQRRLFSRWSSVQIDQ